MRLTNSTSPPAQIDSFDEAVTTFHVSVQAHEAYDRFERSRATLTALVEGDLNSLPSRISSSDAKNGGLHMATSNGSSRRAKKISPSSGALRSLIEVSGIWFFWRTPRACLSEISLISETLRQDERDGTGWRTCTTDESLRTKPMEEYRVDRNMTSTTAGNVSLRGVARTNELTCRGSVFCWYHL